MNGREHGVSTPRIVYIVLSSFANRTLDPPPPRLHALRRGWWGRIDANDTLLVSSAATLVRTSSARLSGVLPSSASPRDHARGVRLVVRPPVARSEVMAQDMAPPAAACRSGACAPRWLLLQE